MDLNASLLSMKNKNVFKITQNWVDTLNKSGKAFDYG